MTLQLAIDASTYVGSVALFQDHALVVALETAMRGEEHERLMPLVDRAIRSHGAEPSAVTQVICGAGPGSFTSLRIAASIAKGLCVGLEVPLLVVPSLALVAAEAIAAEQYAEGQRFAVVMDAMRGDVYRAFATAGAGGRVESVTAHELVSRSSLTDASVPIADAKEYPPHARWVAAAAGLLREVDPRRWEPVYGRLAEAQVKWEAAHGQTLDAATHGT